MFSKSSRFYVVTKCPTIVFAFALSLVLASIRVHWLFNRDIKAASAKAALGSMAYKPSTSADSAKPLAPWAQALLLRLIGSDFLFWVGLHFARDQVIQYVLATPPEQVVAASPQERARVNAILDHILPVSRRASGLRSDSVLGKSLGPSALSAILAPTLVVSVRDDGFGTYASSEYTASQIKGARFVGFEHGGHVWVGHDDGVQKEILNLIFAKAKP